MAQSGDSRPGGSPGHCYRLTGRPVLPRGRRSILGELSICLAFIPLDRQLAVTFKDGISFHGTFKTVISTEQRNSPTLKGLR